MTDSKELAKKPVKAVKSKEAVAVKPSRETRPKRVKRRRLRNQGPLYVSEADQDPNFVYRYVNDTKYRINYLTDAGYEFVLNADGSKVSLGVNTGNDTKAFLMRIPRDYYEENMEAKERDIQALDKSMGRQSGLTNDGVISQKVYK